MGAQGTGGREGVVYDAGALIAADRGDGRFLATHLLLTGDGIEPLVPAVVLAQGWRGGPQPSLSRVLKGCQIIPDTEQTAREAGDMCARAGTSDVVDAIVVVTAARHGATVVTSDPGDLRHLAASMGWYIPLNVI